MTEPVTTERERARELALDILHSIHTCDECEHPYAGHSGHTTMQGRSPDTHCAHCSCNGFKLSEVGVDRDHVQRMVTRFADAERAEEYRIGEQAALDLIKIRAEEARLAEREVVLGKIEAAIDDLPGLAARDVIRALLTDLRGGRR